jgi:hypothetical protein
MSSSTKTIGSQLLSGLGKALIILISLALIIAVIIPWLLSVFAGKDVAVPDDSVLQLAKVDLPQNENAFYQLNQISAINKTAVFAGQDLASGYLNSTSWDETAIKQLLVDNLAVLDDFTAAAALGKFQLPDTDGATAITADLPVIPLNGWRDASRLSGVKALWLARQGQNEAALAEAFKSIIIGNAIENSQSLLITNLVGIEIKDNGLNTLKQLMTMITDKALLAKYQAQLANYQAIGNATPFITEYLVAKQSLADLTNHNQLAWWQKMLLKNKFYFKPNLTLSYYFDFYSRLTVAASQDCASLSPVQTTVTPLPTNIFRLYLTPNVFGRYLTTIPDVALNGALTKKCVTEKKLQAIINKNN